MAGILKDRVAVVTGSGRGLGRAYAMAIAREGARVVINDLGCETDGRGSSHEPADEVVKEITKAGGTAVANYDSVCTSEGANRIIQTAVNNFGRLDILVNNAGVGRDRLIFDMTDEDFDIVVRTHLYGTFYCIRAASRVMKQQKYGRIVNIASIAGFGFTAGEANYASAKEGIGALTRTVSRDLVRFGITCNAIRPQASTRLGPTYVKEQTEIGKVLGVTMIEPGNFAAYGVPEDVAPLVAYLVSEQAGHISNCIFEIHSNYLALYDNPIQKIMTCDKQEGRFTIEELLTMIPKILPENIKLPNPTAAGKETHTKLASGAKGWHLDKEKLTEAPPK
jgi:NAD(P)-dependent dehydrogenase (short-subunit alcohol dehydrogenase family)